MKGRSTVVLCLLLTVTASGHAAAESMRIPSHEREEAPFNMSGELALAPPPAPLTTGSAPATDPLMTPTATAPPPRLAADRSPPPPVVMPTPRPTGRIIVDPFRCGRTDEYLTASDGCKRCVSWASPFKKVSSNGAACYPPTTLSTRSTACCASLHLQESLPGIWFHLSALVSSHPIGGT